MGGIVNFITDIILTICFGVKELAVSLVSMVPIIELKGSIPIGVKFGLGYWESFLWSFIGSSLACIPLLLLLPFLFKLPFLRRVKEVFKTKADKVPQRWKYLGLFLLVAIPIPGTGIWTGSIVAVILGLKFFPSILSIIVGNLVSGLAVVGLTALLGPGGLDWLLLGLFAIFIFLLAFFFFKMFKKKDIMQSEQKDTKSGTY